MKIYLAARFERQDEIRDYRRQLEALGHRVLSSWLDGCVADSSTSPMDKKNIAHQELLEIGSCDCLIMFTGDLQGGYTTAAHKVEFGIAVGLQKNLFIIGPRENVFCYLHKVVWYKTFGKWLHDLGPVNVKAAEGEG